MIVGKLLMSRFVGSRVGEALDTRARHMEWLR